MKYINHEGQMDVNIDTTQIQTSWFSQQAASYTMSPSSGTGVVNGYSTLGTTGGYKLQVGNDNKVTCYKYTSTSCGGDPTTTEVTADTTAKTAQCDNNIFTLSSTDPSSQTGCLSITEQTQSSQASDGCSSSKSASFEATVTMYDGKEVGTDWRANTAQVTNYNGQNQQKTVTFTLYCDQSSAEGAQSGSSTTTTTSGTPSVTFKIGGDSSSAQTLNSGDSKIVNAIIALNGWTYSSTNLDVKLYKDGTSSADISDCTLNTENTQLDCSDTVSSWSSGSYTIKFTYDDGGTTKNVDSSAIAVTVGSSSSCSGNCRLYCEGGETEDTVGTCTDPSKPTCCVGS